MIGRIMESICGVYKVVSKEKSYQVKPRGNIRYKDQNILVGDYVEFDENLLLITAVLPRVNQLRRPLIANVDQVAIIMSIVEPTFSSLLVDKFLTYVNAQQIAPLLIISKTDKQEDLSAFYNKKADLEKLHVPVIIYSRVNKNGLTEIIQALKGKVTVLMGQTGVGKSSLLNELSTDFQRSEGEYSSALGRGKHQTKEVILLPFDQDTLIADTPGFSSLELELFKHEVAQFFPGFGDLACQCYFANCLHVKEKNCKILAMVESGEISRASYQNYLTLLSEAKMRKEWN